MDGDRVIVVSARERAALDVLREKTLDKGPLLTHEKTVLTLGDRYDSAAFDPVDKLAESLYEWRAESDRASGVHVPPWAAAGITSRHMAVAAAKGILGSLGATP